MSEVTLFQGQNLPDYLRNGAAMDATTKALVGGGGGKRISIKGSVFRLVVDGQQIAEKDERSMNVVIVAASPSVNRTFYEGVYQEGVAAAPTCYSQDGITPAADSANPQGKLCSTCPQNIAGSGQNNSRACRYSQRIAVVLDNDLDGDVFQMTLPAQSIFGKPEGPNGKMPLQAYAKHLAAHNVPITAVVTEARFDTSSATPKLTFKAVRPLNEAEFNIVKRQGASDDAKTAITLTVAQMDKAQPATEAGKPARAEPFEQEEAALAAAEATTKAKAGAQDVPWEEKAADTAAEATVRKSNKAKAAEVAEKMGSGKPMSVADIANSWDDDDE